MELPDNNDLEKFIHAQLQKLPDREAPESLLSNVLDAIAAREKVPWWRQSFTHWPKHVQSVLFVVLATVFLGFIYGAGRAADNVSVPDFSEHLSSYAWIGRTLRSIGEALFLAVSNLTMEWFVAIGLVFLLLYGACIAAGFALFKVTSSAGAHAA